MVDSSRLRMRVSKCAFCSSEDPVTDSDDIDVLHDAVRRVAVDLDLAPDVLIHATVRAVAKFIADLPHPLAESNGMTWDDYSITKQYRQTILDSLDLDHESEDR
jgi:hypothetical protein